VPAPGPAPTTPEAAPADWSEEIRYAVLTAIPEVRDRIAHATAGARKGISADDFLGAADKLLDKSLGMPLPMATVADVVEPIYERMGIRTSKRRAGDVQWPAGRVIVAILCSLASRSISIVKVEQAGDGCVIEAKVPSSPRAMAASLLVTASRAQSNAAGAHVEAAATVQGQLFDWGLSKSVLDHLFADIDRYAPPTVVG
jgi:hypothetical protein